MRQKVVNTADGDALWRTGSTWQTVVNAADGDALW
jgi:hypothetical protein